MEEKKVSTLFEEMRDDIGKYINSTLELGKLEAYEKLSLGSSAFLYGLILAGVCLMALLFILVTAGLYLAELLGSLWIGFGIVAAFALLIVIVLLIIKKPLNKKFTNKIIRFLLKQDDKDETKQ
ncbi:MAG: phage holin family protein [Fermentimonas sp.]|nr:phage holin family protein [Fermentimonas sp.]NLC85328.1 phage holin family protein [Bacteroidales bacterium]